MAAEPQRATLLSLKPGMSNDPDPCVASVPAIPREDFVAAAFNGTLESPPWQTLIELLRGRLRASSVILVLRPPSSDDSGVIVHCGGKNLEAKESYQKHFFALDPFVRLEADQVVTVEELIGREEWLRSPFYLEYLSELGIEHILGVDICSREGIECRLRITRNRGEPRFDEDDKDLLRFLLPHLKNAIHLHSRIDTLECERQIFAGTVNRMLLGMISFAENGEIVETNQEARRILSQKDGLSLSGQHLFIDSLRERRDFKRMLEAVIADPEQKDKPLVQAMPVTRPSGRAQLGLLVRPVAHGDNWSENKRRPVVVAYVRDPESSAPQPSSELVRRLFGLTRVESKLALLLVEGLTLDEASERMGIRRNTARTHLREIFSKTGVRRQTLVVKLLLNSVATLG